MPVTPDDLKGPPVEADRGYEAAHTFVPEPAIDALANAPPMDGSRVREDGDLAGKKVLVVDDDVRNLFALTSLLEKRGLQVIPAGSAKEAFSLLEQHADIAVVLMDMMMPEMDGYEATRFLRAQSRYEELPIVALTAKAMPGDKDKAREAGCDDFVPKPVEQDDLLSVLRRWTKEGREHAHTG